MKKKEEKKGKLTRNKNYSGSIGYPLNYDYPSLQTLSTNIRWITLFVHMLLYLLARCITTCPQGICQNIYFCVYQINLISTKSNQNFILFIPSSNFVYSNLKITEFEFVHINILKYIKNYFCIKFEFCVYKSIFYYYILNSNKIFTKQSVITTLKVH